MPSNLLERRLRAGLPTSSVVLNQNQILQDHLSAEARDSLSDPIALTAMSFAPSFGKLGRIGILRGTERCLGTASTLMTRATSSVLGSVGALGFEAVAYEGIQRNLRVFLGEGPSSLLSWESFSEGLTHSFLNIGILKGVGSATAATNPVLSHFASDGAMVAGNQAVAALGMIPQSSESLLHQILQADAMNWQMKGGMSLFHHMMPSLVLNERSLGLQVELPKERAEKFWDLDSSSLSMAANEREKFTPSSKKRLELRDSINAHLGRFGDYVASQISSRKFRNEEFLPLHQRIERIMKAIYPEREVLEWRENDKLERAADQFHRIVESWNSRVSLKEMSGIFVILEEGLQGKVGTLFVEQNVRVFCKKHLATRPASISKQKVKSLKEENLEREVKPYDLRDYQEQMVNKIYEDAINGVSPWLGLASPMQTGKSFLAGPVIQRLREAYGPKARFIVLSSAKIITTQVKNDLLEGFSDSEVGVYDARNKIIRPVTVASVYTLIRHLNDFVHDGPTILINDEAFYTQAPMYRTIYSHFGLGEMVEQDGRKVMRPKAGNGLVVGLSGTGAGLEGYKISGQLNILDAIDKGWIRHMRGDRVMLTIPSEKRESVDDRDMIWWEATKTNAETLADLYDQYLFGKYKRNSIYVPTITHAELLRDAIRKRHGRDSAFAVHSEMEQKGEAGSIDRNFDEVIDYWEKNGGAVISIGQLSRGYRGKGIDACFHTYQSSSPELFGQRTGRGWAGTPGDEGPDYYVLEATWSSKLSYATLPRLLGLVDYPRREFSTRGLRENIKKTQAREESKDEMRGQIREAKMLPLFEQIPLLESWRTAFSKILEKSGGVNALAIQTGLSVELLTGFALGGLPVHREAILALKEFLEEDALYLWIKFWTEATVEISVGVQKVEDRFSQDLLDWAVKDREFHVQLDLLDEILQKYFPKPKVKPSDNLKRRETASAAEKHAVEQSKPSEQNLEPIKPMRKKEDLDLDPSLSEDLRRKLEIPIFSLSVHWNNSCRKLFKKLDIQFVADLVQLKEKDLKELEGFGIDSLKQIKHALWDLDLTLGMEVKKKAPEVSEAASVVPVAKFVEEAPAIVVPEEVVEAQKPVLKEDPELERKLNMSVKRIAWKVSNPRSHSRIKNFLELSNIHKLADLVTKSETELLKMKHLGKVCLQAIMETLSEMGLSLGMNLEGGKIPKAAFEEAGPLQGLFNKSLWEIKLNKMALHPLWENGIRRVGDLVHMTEAELYKIDGIGRESINKIKETLAKLGLSLNMKFKDGKVVTEDEAWPRTAPSIEELSEDLQALLATPLNKVNLSWRVYQALWYPGAYGFQGIKTIGELVRLSQDQALKINGIGHVGLREIQELLASMGLAFGMDLKTWKAPESKDIP